MRVIVGWDLDAPGRAAVEVAARLARGGELWIVHVAAPDPDFVPWEAGPLGERDRVAEAIHAEHRELQLLAEEHRQRGARATALLVQGATAETLLDEVRRREAELLVVGSHRRRGLAKLLLGSVAEEVVAHSSVPVVVVPLS